MFGCFSYGLELGKRLASSLPTHSPSIRSRAAAKISPPLSLHQIPNSLHPSPSIGSCGQSFDDDVFLWIIAKVVDDEDAKGNRTIKATVQCLFHGEGNRLISLMEEKFPELGVRTEDCQEMQWIESALNFSGYGKNKNRPILSSTKPQFNESFMAKSDFAKEPISKEGWEKIWKFMMGGQDEPVTMIMDPRGGKFDEIDEGEVAFPYRKGNLYNVQYYMWWPQTDEKVAEGHLDWMREFYVIMTPYVSNKKSCFHTHGLTRLSVAVFFHCRQNCCDNSSCMGNSAAKQL